MSALLLVGGVASILGGVASTAYAQDKPQPVPVVSTPPRADALLVDKLGDLAATAGGNGLLIVLLWYFFTKREPEREQRHQQLIRELNDQHATALATQRREFMTMLDEQRKLFAGLVEEHRQAREISRSVIEANTKAFAENTAALRDSTDQMRRH